MRDEFFRKAPSMRDTFNHFYPSLRDFYTLLLPNEFVPNLAKNASLARTQLIKDCLIERLEQFKPILNQY